MRHTLKVKSIIEDSSLVSFVSRDPLELRVIELSLLGPKIQVAEYMGIQQSLFECTKQKSVRTLFK